jgi:hypothetical protein
MGQLGIIRFQHSCSIVLLGNIAVREIKYYLLRYDLFNVDIKVKDHAEKNGIL